MIATRFCFRSANFLLVFFAFFMSGFSGLNNLMKFFDVVTANALLLALFLSVLPMLGSSIIIYIKENLHCILKIILNAK